MNAVAEEQQAYAYVYVIGADGGPQKVGFSNNPAIRCRSLGGGRFKVHHAVEVYAEDARAVERYAHCLLYENHARGEWFNVSPDDARDVIQDAALAVQRGEQPPFFPMLFNRKRSNTRSEPLGLRLRPSVKAALERAALDDDRSMALYVERVLVAHLSEKGYLK